MDIKVLKRSGEIEDWMLFKIRTAVMRASAESREWVDDEEVATAVADSVFQLHARQGNPISVETIHDYVEDALMELGYKATAKAYIIHRHNNKPDIFRKRDSILPYEYPEVMQFVKATRDSYWVHTHYKWTSDISDFYNPKVDQHYKDVFTRCILAISQIEVAVKTFWKNIDETLPKHEFSMLAATFDEVESRHFDTYRHLLELVGHNDYFNRLDEFPILKERSDSLKAAIVSADDGSREEFLKKVVLFSSFIENVSLFSQFLIVMSFHKFEKLFSATANGISATNIDETTHFLAGVYITEKIKEENPDLWTEELKQEIVSRATTAVEKEIELIDWIFDGKDLPWITRAEVKNYVRTRMKEGLEMVGLEIFPDLVPVEFDWMDSRETLLSSIDFFNMSGYAYDKGSRSYDTASVFGDGFIAEEFY